MSPLPAEPWTVFNYVGYLAEGGRWAADSLQPVFSAINSAHRDMGFEPPAVDNHFLTQARKGLRRAQVEAGHTRDSRVPLPCEAILTFIDAGERAALELQNSSAPTQPRQLQVLRACFGLSLTSLFAAIASDDAKASTCADTTSKLGWSRHE